MTPWPRHWLLCLDSSNQICAFLFCFTFMSKFLNHTFSFDNILLFLVEGSRIPLFLDRHIHHVFLYWQETDRRKKERHEENSCFNTLTTPYVSWRRTNFSYRIYFCFFFFFFHTRVICSVFVYVYWRLPLALSLTKTLHLMTHSEIYACVYQHWKSYPFFNEW